MTGIEPGSSVIESDRSANCATTTSHQINNCFLGEIRLSSGALTSKFMNRVYWLSWSERPNAQKSWIDAEKTCRSLCMELVSLDTPGETDFIASIVQSGE